jgi:hypothetical protein
MSKYIPLPKDCIPQELQDKVIQLLKKTVVPAKYKGLRFVDYVFRRIISVDIRDNFGNTDNSGRSGGTGKKVDSLSVSLSKGIDVTQPAMAIVGNSLKDGFNRRRDLIDLGYNYWVFAVYEPDESTRTEYQKDDEDAIEDLRLGANVDDGKKPHTFNDFVHIGVNKVRKGSIPKDHDEIKKWMNTISHNFTQQNVGQIASAILKNINRAGNLESFNRNDAEKYLKKHSPDSVLLNTKGSERPLRLMEQIMEHFVSTGETLNIALFSTEASSHQELDAERKATIERLEYLDKLCMDYAFAKMKSCNESYDIIGAVPQKIYSNKPRQSGLVSVK